MNGDNVTIATKAVGPGPRTDAVPPNRPGARTEEIPADGEPFRLALQSLLSAVSTPTADGLRKQGSAASPSQMFEPNRGGGHAGRLVSLKADDRSQDLRDPGRLHVDRGSVQERAAGAERLGGAGKSAPPTSPLLGRSQQQSPTERSTGSEAGKPPGSVQAQKFTGFMPNGRSSGESDGQGISKGDAHQGRRVSDGGSQPAQVSSSESVNRAGGSASAEAVNGSRGSDKTVAQQIARVLSGGRTSAMEAARPVAGSSSTNTTRDPQIAEKATDASTPRDSRSSDELAGQKTRDTGAARGEFDRLVQNIRLKSGSGFSSARLLLDPPELGRVQVDVRLVGDDLQISVLATNQDARDLLAERASELQDALARQGINIQSMEVVIKGLGEGSGRPTQARESDETDRSKRAGRSTSESGNENGDSELPIDGLAEWSSREQAARTEARLDIEV